MSFSENSGATHTAARLQTTYIICAISQVISRVGSVLFRPCTTPTTAGEELKDLHHDVSVPGASQARSLGKFRWGTK